jgi:hypothetical protein
MVRDRIGAPGDARKPAELALTIHAAHDGENDEPTAGGRKRSARSPRRPRPP